MAYRLKQDICIGANLKKYRKKAGLWPVTGGRCHKATDHGAGYYL